MLSSSHLCQILQLYWETGYTELYERPSEIHAQHINCITFINSTIVISKARSRWLLRPPLLFLLDNHSSSGLQRNTMKNYENKRISCRKQAIRRCRRVVILFGTIHHNWIHKFGLDDALSSPQAVNVNGTKLHGEICDFSLFSVCLSQEKMNVKMSLFA